MRKNFFISILILFLVTFKLLFAQTDNSKIDSLENLLKRAKEDTNKVKTLNEITIEYLHKGNYEMVVLHANNALNLSVKLKYERGISRSYNALGAVSLDQGKADQAKDYYEKSIKISEKLNDLEGIAANLNRIGSVFINKGEYHKATEYYLSALKKREEVKARNPDDKKNLDGIADCLNNIGNVNYFQGNYEATIDYYTKAIDIYKSNNNIINIAHGHNNIGLVYRVLGNTEKAIEYRSIALKIYEEEGNKEGIASVNTGLAIIYVNGKQYDLAKTHLLKSLKLYEEMNYQSKIAQTYHNLGDVYALEQNYNKAHEYWDYGYKIARETDYKDLVKEYYMVKAETAFKLKDYKSAYDHFKQYSAIKDTLFNEQSSKNISEMQAKYESEKKQLEIEKLNKENEIQLSDILKKEEEVKRQNTQKIAFAIGFALMIVLALLIFRSYKQKQRANEIITLQKQEVEKQKEIVEEKNREIMDSITYAKRLQEAILPPAKLVKEYLNESFVLYKPKDIVAGDFYWMETIHLDDKNTGDNQILFAVADCTGHGVPGAMVSVVCHNALNRALKEFNIIEPHRILDKVNELVEESFSKSESEVKDGMDISLCCLDYNQMKLLWSGANNPLWIIRNNEMMEYKPDKQPIGKFDQRKPFSLQEITLQKGDTLYVFSDGYADQFGGDKGKKYKYSQFKEKLLEIQGKSMDEQKKLLTESFENWKGNLEQIDDVTVIGVRI